VIMIGSIHPLVQDILKDRYNTTSYVLLYREMKDEINDWNEWKLSRWWLEDWYLQAVNWYNLCLLIDTIPACYVTKVLREWN
jgi:hypothetical protein